MRDSPVSGSTAPSTILSSVTPGSAKAGEPAVASAAAANTEQVGLKERQQQASARAAIAANGLDVNTGSPADVQTSNREIGTLNQETASNNGALQVYGYQSQATSFQAQSIMDSSEVGSDIAGGVLKGGSSFLSNPSVDSALGRAPSIPYNYSWMTSDTSVTGG